ncbi:MAG: glycosyltransferase [Mangrovibacterium sp.]
MFFSIIVPVYNRKEELEELIQSLSTQESGDFEIIVVEDGSSERCDDVVAEYAASLDIKYFFKSNSGPGLTRNFGAERSRGDYLIFLDSDCIVPPRYLEALEEELNNRDCDAFGGADRADDSFTDTQKAINYSMTSFFTTGGIRGKSKSIDKFYPRSFNMGIKRSVFNALGGFSNMRFGEDVDLSYRIIENGYSSRLFPSAWVYHKRRTNFKQFFKQVFNSGVARVVLTKKHPNTLKLVHLLPSLFTLACLFVLFASCLYWQSAMLLSPFVILIFLDALLRTKSVVVSLLSIASSFVQLLGYGSGLIIGWWKIQVCKQQGYTPFIKKFYD